MRSIALVLVLATCATPALSQGVNPALEGEGSQTQSLDLIKGAVSVSVESSGSLSLGRGHDNLDGGLRVTANDATLGMPGATGARGQSGQQADSKQATTVGALPAALGTNARGSGTLATENNDACRWAKISPEALNDALTRSPNVQAERVSCDTPAPGLDALMRENPEFFLWVERQGIAMDSVISITFRGEDVIVSYTAHF